MKQRETARSIYHDERPRTNDENKDESNKIKIVMTDNAMEATIAIVAAAATTI